MANDPKEHYLTPVSPNDNAVQDDLQILFRAHGRAMSAACSAALISVRRHCDLRAVRWPCVPEKRIRKELRHRVTYDIQYLKFPKTVNPRGRAEPYAFPEKVKPHGDALFLREPLGCKLARTNTEPRCWTQVRPSLAAACKRSTPA